MVNASALGIEIFRNAGIDLTLLKVCCMAVERADDFPAFFLKASGIKCVAEHDCHVREDCAVLLLAVGEAEHTAHVGLDLTEISIELITSDRRIVDVSVGGLNDISDLLFGRNAGHDREHLAREHHGRAAVLIAVLLQCVSAVVVVAVISGIALTVGEPFGLSDVVDYPVSLLVEIICEHVDVKGLLCARKTCFNIVTIAQQHGLELICIVHAEETLELFAGLYGSLSGDLFILSKDRCELFVVACIGCREGHALALILAHVERVVPVGASELHVTVLTDVEEGCEILQQEVLHDRSLRMNAAKVGILIEEFLTSHYLAVNEVGSLLVQDLKVACLLYVEVHRHERPHRMVHPDSCDAVPVSDEFAALAANDGRIGAVASYAAEVIDEHAPDVRRVHDYQRQTVLPEVSPASAALAVVVVGEE